MNYERAKVIKQQLNNHYSERTLLEFLLEIELDKIIDKHETDQQLKKELEQQARLSSRQDVDF